MGSKYRIRRIFRPLVTWIAKLFQKLKITPNQVSILGTILAIAGSIFFILVYDYWGSLLFAIFVFTAGLFDGVDGTLARLTNTISMRGGYLDSVLDRYADACIIISFLGHYIAQPVILGMPILIWIIIALVGVIMVSYVRARGEASDIPDCDVGLAGRSERLFILVICASLNFIDPYLAFVGLIIVAIISHLTVVYRIYFIRRKAKSLKNVN